MFEFRTQLLEWVRPITNNRVPGLSTIVVKTGAYLRLHHFYSNFIEALQPPNCCYFRVFVLFTLRARVFHPFLCQPPEGWCFDTKLHMSLIPHTSQMSNQTINLIWKKKLNWLLCNTYYTIHVSALSRSVMRCSWSCWSIFCCCPVSLLQFGSIVSIQFLSTCSLCMVTINLNSHEN